MLVYDPGDSLNGNFLSGPLLIQGISSFQVFEQTTPEMEIQES